MNSININKLIIAIAAIAIAVVIYFVVRQTITPHQPDEQEEVVCGNKKVFRYRNPTSVFPSFTRDYETAVSLTNAVLHKISDSLGETGVGTNIKNKVVELQEKLDQENITFTMSMKSYFFMMNADPCNDSLRYRWMAITEDMTRRMLELNQTTKDLAMIQMPDSTPSTTTTTPTNPNQPGDNASTTQPTTDSAPPAITIAPKPSQIKIYRDTEKMKRSIYKIDELLNKNKDMNRVIFKQSTIKTEALQ